MRTLQRIRKDERGVIGGIEGLAFGILIFVFGMFMVMNTWAVIDGTMAASTAARAAARAYVEADSQSAGANAADEAAQESVAGQNHFVSSVTVSPSDSYERCEPITVAVTLQVPRVSLPAIGAAGGIVSVKSTHTEVIDPYRSGLPGSANCAA